MGKKFGFEFFKKLYCNDLDMLQIHPLDSWKIPAWEEPCTWEGHRVMYARFLPWLSLHSRVSLHWRCGALVATLYVSLDSNKHPWVGNCIKICDNFLAHFVTRMWRVSYPCTFINFWNDGATGLQIQPPSSIVNLNNREKQRKPESFISLKHAATKLEHFCWVVYFLTELLMEINWEDCENACQSRKISNNTSENALL